MTWPRPVWATLGLLAIAITALACGTSFVPARPSEPVATPPGPRTASIERVLLTDDIPNEGMGNDSAIVFELSLTNGSSEPWPVSGALFACLMPIDPERPAETLALTPVGGAEGPFSGEVPGEGSLIGTFTVPPGQTRPYWVLFRGYRFDDSDVPRRVALRIATPGGPALELVVADPGRGKLRWQLPPRPSVWTVGLQSVALASDHLRATGMSNVVARRLDFRRLSLDVGLVSLLLVETHGDLASETSAFLGLGPTVHATVPLVGWGSDLEPRRFGLYAGGSALLLPEVTQQPRPDPMKQPGFYGVLAAEAGIAFDIGTLRFAPTPFPLSPTTPPLPRWTIRAGYTHWWVGGGGTDGYTTSLLLAW
jgi:hypothetical protein